MIIHYPVLLDGGRFLPLYDRSEFNNRFDASALSLAFQQACSELIFRYLSPADKPALSGRTGLVLFRQDEQEGQDLKRRSRLFSSCSS
jgi:hypothetical protein